MQAAFAKWMNPRMLGPATRAWLEEQPWRGNVRELINALERATILSPGPELDLLDAGPAQGVVATRQVTLPSSKLDANTFPTLKEMERHHIRRAMEISEGKLYGPGGSAEILGLNPSTLRSRMQKLGLGSVKQFQST